MSLDYKYRLTKRWAVGISIGFAGNESTTYTDGTYDLSDVSSTNYGTSSASLVYAIPTITYTWFQSDNGIFRMYSGAGAGLALLKEKIDVVGFECDRTKADLAYNVTMFGMSVGGQHIKYFWEMNAGCKGLLTAGLEVRF